jgi:hypothetical protein
MAMTRSQLTKEAAGLVVYALALPAVLVLPGCGFGGRAQRAVVPNITREPLDAAEDELDAHGLHYRTVGGGVFGIVVRSHWNVCKQFPAPGLKAYEVTLYVARDCEDLIPEVVGASLADAEEQLRRAGIAYSEESLGSGPIIVESLWTVCDQSPTGGEVGSSVELYVSHDCEQDWRTS